MDCCILNVMMILKCEEEKKMHKNSKFNFKELDSFSVLKVDPKYKVLKTFS